MIERVTTLVLGAGASAPYGLPIGSELQSKIVSGLRDGAELRRLLIGVEVRPGDLEEFRERLDRSRSASIDAFVRRNDQFHSIAKLVIAATIIQSEDPAHLDFPEPENHDWYQVLWDMMERALDFKQNQLGIITFNYDRSFEQYFSRRLSGMYDDKKAQALLDRIMPVHVHGEVGGTYGGRRLDPEALIEAAKELKILPPGVGPDDRYRQARNTLSESDVICFLGFAYHQDSLERLMPSELRKDVRIFGSTYLMSEADRLRAAEGIRTIALGAAPQRSSVELVMGATSEDARLFLRNNVIL